MATFEAPIGDVATSQYQSLSPELMAKGNRMTDLGRALQRQVDPLKTDLRDLTPVVETELTQANLDPSQNPEIAAIESHERFVEATAREASTVAMLDLESVLDAKRKKKRLILEFSTALALFVALQVGVSGDTPAMLALGASTLAADFVLRYNEFGTPRTEAMVKSLGKAFLIILITNAMIGFSQIAPDKNQKKIEAIPGVATQTATFIEADVLGLNPADPK